MSETTAISIPDTPPPLMLPATAQPQTGIGAFDDQETVKAVQNIRDRMVMAKQFPRDQQQALNRILASCRRPSFADVAEYALPRGGKVVRGPSIKLAREIARQWGSVDVCNGRELSSTDSETVVEVSATDLETNTRVSEILTVKHQRYTKSDGLKSVSNPDDIYMLCAARAAKRVRQCIIGLIPGDVTDYALDECRRTIATNGNLSERIAKMSALFASLGVTEAQLVSYLRKPLKDVVYDELVGLGAIYNTIHDKEASVDDYFEKQEAPAPVAETKKPKVKKQDAIVDAQVVDPKPAASTAEAQPAATAKPAIDTPAAPAAAAAASPAATATSAKTAASTTPNTDQQEGDPY